MTCPKARFLIRDDATSAQFLHKRRDFVGTALSVDSRSGSIREILSEVRASVSPPIAELLVEHYRLPARVNLISLFAPIADPLHVAGMIGEG